MKIMVIDPGDKKSAWLVFDTAEFLVLDFGLTENAGVVDLLQSQHFNCSRLIAELVKSYGNVIGDPILKTAFWTGRFVQAFGDDENSFLVPRKTIVTHLCGRATASDKNIRQALIDAFPATGGGKTPAIGTKSKPGPLYGISKDVWAALAVAVYWTEVFSFLN